MRPKEIGGNDFGSMGLEPDVSPHNGAARDCNQPPAKISGRMWSNSAAP